jgi:hypothetical protein
VTTWRNWSGLETATPARVAVPADTEAVIAEVNRARESGDRVKMVGTGHSFTAIAAPEGTMLRPDALTGVVGVDRGAMTVTAWAGTTLKQFNSALQELGLSLHNMGDIAEQTLAGAVSTGTHGTGGTAASLSAQLVGLELVSGTGELVRASTTVHPDILEMARVGLGALGILTTATFRVEPLFVLEAHEQPMSWDQALGSFDEMTASSDHVDMYWFPHTDRMLTKRNRRLGTDLSQASPLTRWRSWVDDDFLQNTAFGVLTAAANRSTRVIPRMNRVAARLLNAPTAMSRTGCSPRSAGSCSGRWSTPCRVPRDSRCSVRRAPRSRARPWRSASPWRSGSRPQTTSRCPRRTTVTPSTLPSTPIATQTTGSTSR